MLLVCFCANYKLLGRHFMSKCIIYDVQLDTKILFICVEDLIPENV